MFTPRTSSAIVIRPVPSQSPTQTAEVTPAETAAGASSSTNANAEQYAGATECRPAVLGATSIYDDLEHSVSSL
jgi:hypothetical protein